MLPNHKEDHSGGGELGQYKSGYITLPFDEDQFKDFVKTLLGSPQSITKTIQGSFEIKVEDLRDIHSLIMQRVTQQNESALVQFAVKIMYSDNSSVELNTIEELLTYNEVRPVISESVHLKWDFLVKFQDKKVPEKQRIQVSFVSPDKNVTIYDDEDRTFRPMYLKGQSGAVVFRIEHTARTWGADIEALLTGHIESLLTPPSKLKKIIDEHSGKISLAVGGLFFLTSLVVSFLVTKGFSTAKVLEATKYLEKNSGVTTQALNLKIEYLAKFVTEGQWSQFYFAVVVFIFISLFLSILFAAWVEAASEVVEPGFVLLTKESRKHKEVVLRKLEKKWLSFIAAIVMSIITGVVSNILFTKFFGDL